MSYKSVSLNLDTVIAAMEARPETRARIKAWEWLAEQSSVTVFNDSIFVPSAQWSSTLYLASPERCNCKAKGACWHMEAATIITAARAEDARYDALAERDAQALPFDLADDLATFAPAQRKAKAYADIMECFA